MPFLSERNGILIHAAKQMNLKRSALSERSQTQQATYRIILYIWPSCKGPTIGTETISVWLQRAGRGNLGWGGTVPCPDYNGDYRAPCIYQNSQKLAPKLNFILCRFFKMLKSQCPLWAPIQLHTQSVFTKRLICDTGVTGFCAAAKERETWSLLPAHWLCTGGQTTVQGPIPALHSLS